MRGICLTRRRLLRLWAYALGMAAVPAIAQPPGRGARHHRWRHRRRLPVVAIDAGHGGSDPGAISLSGAYEKTIVYGVARDLERDLLRTHRFRVVMTRRGDRFVGLRERVARARRAHADLFLSIHADRLPDSAMRGLSVFTLSAKASDREAAALAASENGADSIGGIDLSHRSRAVGDVLIALAQRETANLSSVLARDLVAAMGRKVSLLDHPHRSAGFVVLTAPDIPSALVELGCLSNPTEERLLRKPAYRRRLAHGLLRAIEAYFAVDGRLRGRVGR
jgi:N-acetylmuramoyl-L-alanine amidase